jgi:spermidine synthase
VMKAFNIVSNNQYSTTKIFMDERRQSVTLNVNHSNSARMSKSFSRMFDYVQFIERNFIKPTLNDKNIQPLDILILGAGGFTMGYGDTKNNYIYVDIDKDLLEIAEIYLLEKPLEENKEFFPQGARAYLSENDQKFDLIVVDLYSNEMSIPSHVITHEFYKSVKAHLEKRGVVVMNIIASPYFEDDFSRHIDETIRSVFSPINRHLVRGYNPWVEKKHDVNTIYVYVDKAHFNDPAKTYTDNLNTHYLDK